jgi:RNA polymerase sigma-70 factor (ECF subfamily)
MRNAPPEIPVSLVPPPGDGASAADAQLQALLQGMRAELFRFACWLARDRAIAEDVVQEALLRAWRSREALKDPAAVRPWLLTIVRREHARIYERKRLEMTNLHDAIDTEDPALAAQGDGELIGLRLAIYKLPEVYRAPLVMQVLGGFSTAEIASELGLSNAAVLTRLFRARNRLRVLYGLAPAPEALDEELP